MRVVLAIALAASLSGCGSVDFYGDTSDSTPLAAPQATAAPPVQSDSVAPLPAQTAENSAAVQPASAPPVQTAVTAPDPHCTKLAKLRAVDAAYEGEDPDTQRAVYDRTYSDCTAWDAKHRS